MTLRVSSFLCRYEEEMLLMKPLFGELTRDGKKAIFSSSSSSPREIRLGLGVTNGDAQIP